MTIIQPKREDKVRKVVEFRKELVDWISENFPGSFWWIVNECLEYFKEAIQDNMAKRYMKIGAEALAEKVDNNLSKPELDTTTNQDKPKSVEINNDNIKTN